MSSRVESVIADDNRVESACEGETRVESVCEDKARVDEACGEHDLGESGGELVGETETLVKVAC